MADLLLKARADINAHSESGGLFRALELVSRAYLQLRKPRSALIQCFAEQSSTPLGFACLFGSVELIEMYLEAGADLDARNKRGRTPIDLAQSQAVVNIIRTYKTIQGNWRPQDWEAPPEYHCASSISSAGSSVPASRGLAVVRRPLRSCSSESFETPGTSSQMLGQLPSGVTHWCLLQTHVAEESPYVPLKPTNVWPQSHLKYCMHAMSSWNLCRRGSFLWQSNFGAKNWSTFLDWCTECSYSQIAHEQMEYRLTWISDFYCGS